MLYHPREQPSEFSVQVRSADHATSAGSADAVARLVVDRAVRHDGNMPTISRFLGIVITMYFDDHGPPHFHARHPEGAAKIRIDTLEPIDTTLGRRQLRFVLAWAELHQAELMQNWRRARAGETLTEIEPLR